MMEIVRNSSLGCAETDRVEVLAFTAEMALRRPAPNLTPTPPYPAWHRKAAVDLVLYLESLDPKRSAKDVLDDALLWLRSLGLNTENTSRRRELSKRTLERWVHEHRRVTGQRRPVGRPPK